MKIAGDALADGHTQHCALRRYHFAIMTFALGRKMRDNEMEGGQIHNVIGFDASKTFDVLSQFEF